eukprot:Hpha_TRINITY_DN11055_c0_g1::TRINITY_DN11055_c0_g1_i2::g.92781::m.92781
MADDWVSRVEAAVAARNVPLLSSYLTAKPPPPIPHSHLRPVVTLGAEEESRELLLAACGVLLGEAGGWEGVAGGALTGLLRQGGGIADVAAALLGIFLGGSGEEEEVNAVLTALCSAALSRAQTSARLLVLWAISQAPPQHSRPHLAKAYGEHAADVFPPPSPGLGPALLRWASERTGVEVMRLETIAEWGGEDLRG